MRCPICKTPWPPVPGDKYYRGRDYLIGGETRYERWCDDCAEFVTDEEIAILATADEQVGEAVRTYGPDSPQCWLAQSYHPIGVVMDEAIKRRCRKLGLPEPDNKHDIPAQADLFYTYA